MSAVETERLTATQLLELVCDLGTYSSWDEPLEPWARTEAYERDLASARERTGVDESVLSGEGRIDGRRVALVASEFGFLGGSIGRDAARRLVRAIERATAERLPLLAGPASGGTRLQEGTAAFVSMIDISAAIGRHKAAGLPYLVYLRNPTTGGVMSSWASLGHVAVAEPGAMLGFLGPRVYRAIKGEAFPEGVQTAENYYRHGLIDALVPPRTLPRIVARALRVLSPELDGPAPPVAPIEDSAQAPVGAWEVVTASRNPARPGLRKLLDIAADDVLPLNGTGRGEADHGILLALARFGTASCVVIGHDRKEGRRGVPFGPAALRQAQRGMRLSAGARPPPRVDHRHPRRGALARGGGGRAAWRDRQEPRRAHRTPPRRQSPSCWARAPAEAPSPRCRPTSCSRPGSHGSRRSRPKAAPRSSTGTRLGRPRSPRGSA